MKKNATRKDVMRLIVEGRLVIHESGIVEARRQGGALRACVVELVNAPGRDTKYARVSFCGFRALVHRLVWWAYRGQIPKGHEIDHVNETKLDNRLQNLESVTGAENKRRAIASGRSPVHAPKNWSIDEEIVRTIRARVAAGDAQSVVASDLQITRNLVNRIVLGRTYRSVA